MSRSTVARVSAFCLLGLMIGAVGVSAPVETGVQTIGDVGHGRGL
ncbi:MAG TPA: hypothetical protein VJ925_00910 [Longimicrobiales bacterium]|nr:hypothetical protein [Longimicrobiales bacterium]